MANTAQWAPFTSLSFNAIRRMSFAMSVFPNTPELMARLSRRIAAGSGRGGDGPGAIPVRFGGGSGRVRPALRATAGRL